MTNFTIIRRKQQVQYFTESLSSNVTLDMVLIPGGSFMMGAPESEEGSSDDEKPQHPVSIPAFFMAKYPVTQAQWRVVAALPQISRRLDAAPSHFKGDDRPVEQVSWHDATEFCARLSQKTGKPYRLPTEAEWEYACRAGTTTPFHFGETITTELANYRGTDLKELGWSGSFGRGPKGIYREETTDVGEFPTNAFGLYDMHGNVWEWCADHWHDNYGGAPTDGSAWLSEDENARRLLRGGSWPYDPRLCRSAYRYWNAPDNGVNYFGFRLACSLARTL